MDPLSSIFGLSTPELFAQRELFVTHGPLSRLPAFMRTGPVESIDALCRFYTGPLEVAQGTTENGIQVPVRDVHASALLRLGLTVYFTELRRALPFANGWLRAVEAELGVPECASLAAFTNAVGSGLPLHHDRFDQLFFQIRGTKTFRYAPNDYVHHPDLQFSPTAAAPSEFGRAYRHGFPLSPEELVRDRLQTLVLEPGSAFFMPAGTWHATADQHEESLSLIVVVRAPSRLDLLLNFLEYYAGQSSDWRGRAYGGWSAGERHERERQALTRLMGDLGERLATLPVEDTFGAWTAHGYTLGTLTEYPKQTRYRRFIRLPNSTARFEHDTASGKVRCVVLSGPTNRPQTQVDLAFNAEARPVLDWMLELRRAFTVDEASERFTEFSRDDIEELCACLAQAALLRPLPTPEWDEPGS
jgi:hypothetical protein